ncbi:hypothetical protein [Rhodococcus sp. NPDC127528]
MPSLIDQLYACRANLDAAKRQVVVLEQQMESLLAQYGETIDLPDA